MSNVVRPLPGTQPIAIRELPDTLPLYVATSAYTVGDVVLNGAQTSPDNASFVYQCIASNPLVGGVSSPPIIGGFMNNAYWAQTPRNPSSTTFPLVNPFTSAPLWYGPTFRKLTDSIPYIQYYPGDVVSWLSPSTTVGAVSPSVATLYMCVCSPVANGFSQYPTAPLTTQVSGFQPTQLWVPLGNSRVLNVVGGDGIGVASNPSTGVYTVSSTAVAKPFGTVSIGLPATGSASEVPIAITLDVAGLTIYDKVICSYNGDVLGFNGTTGTYLAAVPYCYVGSAGTLTVALWGGAGATSRLSSGGAVSTNAKISFQCLTIGTPPP